MNRLKLRLYVAGDTQNSLLARANLSALCRDFPAFPRQIEVIDVLKEPMRALTDDVLMTPTLVVLGNPVRRIVGTLSSTPVVLNALGLGDVCR